MGNLADHAAILGDDECVRRMIDDIPAAGRLDLLLGIDGYVQQADGEEALAAINALYAGVIETLFPQPYFDGLVEEIDQGKLTVNIAERANARRLAFSLDLNLSYATRRGSPQVID